MGQLPREFQRMSRVFNVLIRNWCQRLPVNSTDRKAPVRIDVKNIIFRVECQFFEEGLPSHDEDEIPDPVGLAREVLGELLFVEQLIPGRESRINMYESTKKTARAETGEAPRDIYCRRFLLNEVPSREGVQGEVLDTEIIPDTSTKKVKYLHITC